MTPEQLSATIVRALASLVEEGAVTLPEGAPASVVVERPKSKEHGDYATNVALQLAKKAGVPPRELAGMLAERLRGEPGVEGVDVAGPGFLNIGVETGAQGAVAAEIVAAGPSYGTTDTLGGRRVNVEFISANPTGPLHLGHTRWAVVGDAIARVLEAAGGKVEREFYINDRGNQMDKFAASLDAVARGEQVPEDGYHGGYVHDLARRVVAEHPGILDLPEQERLAAFREDGYRLQLAEQREQLERFNTHFDVWFSERSLHDSGRVEHGLDKLRTQGHLFEADGALWMRTTDFGDDKDRVLVRGNGELTYFASDTAYYIDKRERGFDVCIYLLGADHHGYVGRLKAMAACAGDDPETNIEVLIGQLVKIVKGGEEVRLSKRAGQIVTLQELVDMVGVDALRYSLARYPADSPLTLDVEQITRQTSDNPVFYVQYAHARLASILRNATDLGLGRPPTGRIGSTPRCWPTSARATCCVRWPSSRAWWPPPRSCASRTGWHATSRTPRRRSTSSTTPAGCCRPGDEDATDPSRPAAARPGDQDVLANGLDCSGSPPPSGCEPSCEPHEAGWAHAEGALRGPAWLRRAADVNALVPHAVVARRREERRRGAGGRRGRPARPGRRARLAGVRPGRGRLPARARAFRERSPTTTSTTPARRSCARRWRAGSPRRGSRLDVCSAGELPVAAARRVRPGADRLPRQQQVPAELRRAVETGVGRIVVDSFAEIDRLAAVTAELGAHAGRDGPGHRRRRGAHPRVHRHRARGPEVRLLDHLGDAFEAVRRVPARPGCGCSACTPTSAPRSSTPPGSRWPPAGCSPCTPRLRRARGGDARARPRRRLRHRLHHPGRPLGPRPARHRADRRSSSRSAGRLERGRPALSIEPGRAIVGPGDVHRLRGRHRQAGGARRRGAVRTYVSVDGGMSDNIRTALYDADYSCTLASRRVRRAAGARAGRRQALRGRATSWSRTSSSRATSPPATCWPCPAPAPTAARWPATTTTRCGPRWSRCADGRPAVIVRRETEDDLLATDVGA